MCSQAYSTSRSYKILVVLHAWYLEACINVLLESQWKEMKSVFNIFFKTIKFLQFSNYVYYFVYYVIILSGCLTLAMTNPIWVVKTRLCLKDSSALPDHMRYHHFRDGIYKLVKYEGLSGMYKVKMSVCSRQLGYTIIRRVS